MTVPNRGEGGETNVISSRHFRIQIADNLNSLRLNPVFSTVSGPVISCLEGVTFALPVTS